MHYKVRREFSVVFFKGNDSTLSGFAREANQSLLAKKKNDKLMLLMEIVQCQYTSAASSLGK